MQTPDFVEEFILDDTLDPAIREYGVEEIKIIDPACGSGHFLLGAFYRLLAAWQEKEPGTEPRELARRALEQVHGVDLNPYAVAISRFRLTLAYLEAAGHLRLKGAPPLPIKVAVADSLIKQRKFSAFDAEDWEGATFDLEDTEQAAEILREGEYHVVVGNPPYINVKDKALNRLYRSDYESCHRKYQLVAPFLERFFGLALAPKIVQKGGFVGAIVGNGFMKREFGTKLIENVLSKQQLTKVVDTSGAYIPGHGTPTVVLFGRRWKNPNRLPTSSVIAVMGKRGEPTTPDDPANGEVWSTIRRNHRSIGYEDDYISVTDEPRDVFSSHPWSLRGGGAAGLKRLLEKNSESTLGDHLQSVGFMAITGEDDGFVLLQLIQD